MIRKVLSLVLIIASLKAEAGDKIKIYFNHAVDNSVSTGADAIYLNNCMADTLVAYINRAQYTIDIAQYDYNQGSYANIATAINNAYGRGVQVRWIYDGSATNAGLSLLNTAIHTLGSPTSGSYGIMHNKFMVIDGNSTDPGDAIVWTGSADWTLQQFNTDMNNIIIFQDSALAHVYTAEFNMMWGGTGIAPDLTLSQFGPHKTDLGRHNFTIAGKHLELYFSPSDGTNDHIQATIATANTDLYFGMYAFTDNTDASLIVSKYAAGVYVAGINDSWGNSYAPHTTFTTGLGSNFLVYSLLGLYHNKFMIVDPSDKCSDPLVWTGSHNWSVSADTKNDENSVVIHDDTAANMYYQSFRANFALLGGSLSTVAGCPTGVPAHAAATRQNAHIYPNPTSGTINISYQLATPGTVNISIYNMLGARMAQIVASKTQQPGDYNYSCTIPVTGLYYVEYTIEGERFVQKVAVE